MRVFNMSLESIISVLSMILISLILALIFIVFIISLFIKKSNKSDGRTSLKEKNVIKYPQTNNIILKRNLSPITHSNPQKVNHSNIKINQLYKPFNNVTNNFSNSIVNPTYNSNYKIYSSPQKSFPVEQKF
jgi:hypothetical protein